MATVARTWTVTTWNLHGSAGPPIASVAARLRAVPSDVVVLQEIRRRQAESLADALGMHHHWALKHYPLTPLLKSKAEGMAILTPHALSSTGSTSLTPKQSRWTYKHRIVVWGLVERPDHSGYRVYDVHLSPHDDAAHARLEQAQQVAALAADHGGAPPIVVGDFNDSGGSDVSDVIDVLDVLPGVEGQATAFTNPAAAPTRRIDHVLVPDAATDIAVMVPTGGAEWAALSDHLPVTTTFTLDWVAGDFPVP
ncbi:MAG: endonuclease/exonuclease/phosphatase family protein [Ilumatobacteraceae bacterium]